MTVAPDAEFTAAYAAGTPRIVSRRLIDDLETPVSAYLKLGWRKPYAFLFESVSEGKWRDRYSILTLKPDLVWRCFGETAEIARGDGVKTGRFVQESLPTLESLRALIASCRLDVPADLPPMIGGLFGVFGYDMVRLMEPLGEANPDPLELPDSILVRPSVIAVFDSIAQEILLCAPVWPEAAVRAEDAFAAAQARLDQVERDLKAPLDVQPPRKARDQAPLTSHWTQDQFCEAVEKAKAYIATGDVFQVVPSQRFEAPFDLDPFSFYRALRRQNPSPFLFYLDFGGFQMAGSSPEILLRIRDGKMTLRPLAGTRKRGATPEEDKALEAELLADPKERAEHLMLIDLGRNDVTRVAKPGSVRVTEQFVVERYSQVMHIVSNVEGEAPDDVDPIEALLSALPAGTLSGAPKVRAMQIIDELEPYKRGVAYAGGVGYVTAAQTLDVCIVLRTALFKDGKIHVQSGAGVVADSDPVSEYEETRHKARALERAAADAWKFA